MPLIPNSPRKGGGITGKAQANVNKVYQQMEQQKQKAAPPSQKMPYKPNSAPSPAQKMPYTPPKDGSGPRAKTMPFKPESQKPKSVKTPNTAVKKTSRPGVTITGTATGTKSLTAAQVARFNKLTGKTNMGSR